MLFDRVRPISIFQLYRYRYRYTVKNADTDTDTDIRFWCLADTDTDIYNYLVADTDTYTDIGQLSRYLVHTDTDTDMLAVWLNIWGLQSGTKWSKLVQTGPKLVQNVSKQVQTGPKLIIKWSTLVQTEYLHDADIMQIY